MALSPLSFQFSTSDTVETLGPSETDVSVIPFIRESDIDFIGYNLRPNREVWYYFDDKNMDQFVSRPNVLILDTQKNFGDMLFNTPREDVRVAGGRARVLLNETHPTNGNTRLYIGEIRNPTSNVGVGNSVIGVLTNLRGNVVSYQHFSGLVANANTTTITLSRDAAPTDNFYFGNTITIVTGRAAGQAANIVSYNGSSRIARVSPALTVAPRRNDNYSLGDIRKNYAASITQRHYTTDRGFIPGTLHLPDPNANTSYAFRTGDRIFRILDNPLNQLFTTDGDKAYTCRADYRYTTNGLLVEQTQIINRVTTTNVVSVSATVFDPIAQSFFVDGNEYKEGFFIPSIDLFFRNRGENLPVQVQIRPMVEGYPDSETVLPYAEATLLPEQVKVSDLPNTQNSMTATRFTFPSPVYVSPDQEYAFVILTNDYGYDLWVSEVGQTQVGSNRWVSEQPYLGSMFKSQSGRTFTALQNEDVMFQINKCVFTNAGQIVFSDRKNANSRLPYYANTDFSSNSNFDFFHYQSDFVEIPGTKVNFFYRATSNTSKLMDTTYTEFRPEKNTLLEERKEVFGPEYAPSFNVQTQMSTTNPDVSPVIFYNRQNLVVIKDIINNMEISNALITIANSGSGYYNTNTSLTFTTSDTGVTANGYVVSDANGSILEVVVDAPGSGYFSGVTATLTANSGVGGSIIVSSETDPSGGPGIAKYIGKTVTLQDGFDAGDLRVFVTAVKPRSANVQVYFKVKNSLDPDSIDDKNWVKMVQKGNELRFSTNSETIEYEFRPSLTSNAITYTTSSATYKTFNQFKVKIVLASSSTLFQDVPLLYDVRAIALPADIF